MGTGVQTCALPISVQNIFPLDEDASVGELARLLGGAQITKNILDSAKEMKEMAKRV